ncbi:MAG: hypothetical protein H6Q89_2935 [Myxococcaceae bacterium]|nr:hypothetical protein [Myxococcaceae bacterium]
MRIALLSTCALTTPPTAYGGTELVIAEIAHGLVELGHEVSVLAVAGSRPKGRLYTCSAETVWPPNDLAELRHAAAAWKIIAREGFDVVHVHHATALSLNHLLPEACVHTLHHVRNEKLLAHYLAYPEVAYVAISHRQAQQCPELEFAGVVHHGLDPARYPYGGGRGGYCAFIARFAPEKAPHLALLAARKAGIPIRLAGRPDDVTRDQEYFHRKVLPLVKAKDTTLVGELPHVPKVAFLAGARAMLMPLDWEEPFGLNMIEAMLVGTPVIAFGRGAVPEVVEEGVTGFIVHSVDEMAERLGQLDGFDRRACRARALERWSYRRMAADYVKIYERVAWAGMGRELTESHRHSAWGP